LAPFEEMTYHLFSVQDERKIKMDVNDDASLKWAFEHFEKKSNGIPYIKTKSRKIKLTCS
jgi:hypothetical protein